MKIDKKTMVGLGIIVVLLIVILFMVLNDKKDKKREGATNKEDTEKTEEKEIVTEKENVDELRKTIDNMSNKDVKDFITDENKTNFPIIYKLCQALKSYKENLDKIKKQNKSND